MGIQKKKITFKEPDSGICVKPKYTDKRGTPMEGREKLLGEK